MGAPTAPGLPLSRLLELTAEAVQAVRGGRSLNDLLPRVPAEARPGVQALSFHVLRWLGSATELRSRLAPKTPPPVVEGLLLTALALLWPVGAPGAAGAAAEPRQPYPDHTLVDQTVAAVRTRAPAAAGFVNAVLRRFIRERATLAAAVRHAPVGAYNHPLWWVERVRQDWPGQWQALLEAANLHPPMVLRVNARRGTAAAYVQRLAAEGRSAQWLQAPGLGDQAVLLQQPCAVHLLPGFAQGDVSVQDAAAQRAARLLLGLDAPPGSPAAPLPAGARVLDACAAPGGKTAHLLELADLELVALDSDAQRLTRVHDTLQRLQLPAGAGQGPGRVALQVADARQTRAWWDGRPFDAILLDAPCTASGIVRRHPDVRWLRRAEDITALARTQAALLDALWPLLKPGGRLLYATCSLFKAEGEHQIDAFLQRHGAASPRLDPASPGHLLPLADNPGSTPGLGAALQDGFFYALLHKPLA
jgi:16S rRNA (cytosine967-C5)-methyltransferase